MSLTVVARIAVLWPALPVTRAIVGLRNRGSCRQRGERKTHSVTVDGRDVWIRRAYNNKRKRDTRGIVRFPVTLQRRSGPRIRDRRSPRSSVQIPVRIGTVVVRRVRAFEIDHRMLDGVRCLMSAVAAWPSTVDRDAAATAAGERKRTDDRRPRPRPQRRRRGRRDDHDDVRVHRVSSRFPAVQVRTRMDSYSTAVDAAAVAGSVVVRPLAWPRRDNGQNVREDGHDRDDNGDDDDEEDNEDEDDEDEDEEGHFVGSRCSDSDCCCSDPTKTACSSASDTDFYYVDRTADHGGRFAPYHATVLELRDERVQTAVREEEFHDSLTAVQVQDPYQVAWPNGHRHVLSDTCRVKVQNLRYFFVLFKTTASAGVSNVRIRKREDTARSLRFTDALTSTIA